MGKMNRIMPNPQMYTKDDADTKKPKSTILVPMDKMVVTPHGFYIFTVVQGSMKQTLWLLFMVGIVFFFLLFRVWPEWLRLGVWYVSWYLLCFLVSLSPFRLTVALCTLDWNSNRQSYFVVRNLAYWSRLLALPQLLH